ncbi:nucleoside triphosphate pyrophosphohydrolase [bacterium]|nr:nucleoside triphosphate pyrophosphohydrolase [bacterium]
MEALAAIMRILREPNGCPWDRKQTHQSLRPYLLEEAYEVLEVLDNGDYEELREELGDLLLQIVFHARIAAEEGRFELKDSIRAIREKLIERHPHVFGELKLDTADDVRDNWEKIKLNTRNGGKKKDQPKGTLSGVPHALPALTRAFRVQEKMAGVGFDWPSAHGALDKLDEEIEEAREAILSGNREAAEEEIGDLLFSVVNAARLSGFGAEESLRRSTEKVIGRFEMMERMVREDGKQVPDLNLEQLDVYWERAKKRQKGE